MAERTFQFGGEKKNSRVFSRLQGGEGDWISSYQSADIFLFPTLFLSVQSNQFVITLRMPQKQA
jgi:hypothetical protein